MTTVADASGSVPVPGLERVPAVVRPVFWETGLWADSRAVGRAYGFTREVLEWSGWAGEAGAGAAVAAELVRGAVRDAAGGLVGLVVLVTAGEELLVAVSDPAAASAGFAPGERPGLEFVRAVKGAVSWGPGLGGKGKTVRVRLPLARGSGAEVRALALEFASTLSAPVVPVDV